jgi:predicted HAD superfamily Cof-like phosphohydrolase
MSEIKINMPYIKKETREKLDPKIDELVEAIVAEAQKDDPKTTFVGILNYACTTTALKTTKKLFGQMRYWIIASLTGLFHNMADEFYRRLGAPYEEEQMKNNGDLDLYRKF